MKKFFKKYDIWNKLLAILIAIGMWAFVVSEENGLERTVKYTVPITLTGEEQLLQDHSLAVIQGQDSTVVLTVTGTNPTMIKLKNDDFKVTVDVSDLTEAKTYKNVPYKITMPSTSSDLKLRDSTPTSISLTTDTMTSTKVSVEAVCAESAPDGYFYAKPTVYPGKIRVYGPESVLKTIKEAHTSVPMDHATENVSKECKFVLQDEKGKPVDPRYLQTSEDSVEVMVNVYKLKTVPLKVSLASSPEIKEDMASVTIDPETVQVYGKADAIDQLQSLPLGVLDLGREQTGSQIVRSIVLPDGVHLASGQPSSAKITLQIDGVATRTVNISNITLVDINAQENKPDVALKTDSVQVTLRGKTSVLNALSVDDIQVSAQFDSSALDAGVHSVALSVSVKTSEVTIVGHTPSIVIEITKKADSAAEKTENEEASQ